MDLNILNVPIKYLRIYLLIILLYILSILYDFIILSRYVIKS